MNHQANGVRRRGKGNGMDAKRVAKQRGEGETGGLETSKDPVG